MSFEVTQGEVFEFEYALTNVGEDAATQDIVLKVDGTEEDRDSDVSVGNNGGRASGTLTYNSTNVDLGSYSVSVESGDDTASDTIEVVAAGNFTLSITSTNSPVTEGSDLDVDVDVTNTGKETDGQTIELVIGGNLRATKYVEVDSGNTKSITLTWATSGGDAGDYTATVNSLDDTATASVSVKDGTDATGFTESWSHSQHGNSIQAIAEGDTHVYSIDSDGQLISTRKSDGVINWTDSSIHGNFSSWLHFDDGHLYSACNDGKIRKIKPDGTLANDFTPNNGNGTAGIFHYNNTVGTGSKETAYAVDDSLGSEIWSSSLIAGNDFASSAYVDSDGVVIGESNSGQINRFDLSDGSPDKSVSVGSGNVNRIRRYNGDYIIALGGGAVTRYEYSTETELWSTTNGGPEDIELGNGVVYVAPNTSSGTVYSYDLSDGSVVLNETPHSTFVKGVSVDSDDDAIYTGDVDNVLKRLAVQF